MPVPKRPALWTMMSLRIRGEEQRLIAKAARNAKETRHAYARRVLLESAARDTGKEAA